MDKKWSKRQAIHVKKQRLITPQNRSLFDSGYRVMQGEREFVAYREDSTIRVWYCATADAYSEHKHSSVEVVLPHQGECSCVVDGVEHVVKDTDVLFVPPDTPHSLHMEEGSIRSLILFDMEPLRAIRGFSTIASMTRSPFHLTPANPICVEVRTKLFELMDKYYARPALMNMICYSYLLQIYVLLGQTYLDYMSMQEEDTEADMRQEENSWLAINRVVEYINKNYAEPITLDSIARVAGFSKYYFSRLFTKYTGTPFSQFLLRKRISVAAQLLCSTQLPIVQVSMQSGFSSLSTFNRTFKELHGCTPTEYRAIYEKNRQQEHSEA